MLEKRWKFIQPNNGALPLTTVLAAHNPCVWFRGVDCQVVFADVIWPHVGLLDSCYYCRWFTGECRNVTKANAHGLSPLMGGASSDWTWQNIFVKNCILFVQCDCSGYILIVEGHSYFRFWAIFENYCKIFDVKICHYFIHKNIDTIKLAW